MGPGCANYRKWQDIFSRSFKEWEKAAGGFVTVDRYSEQHLPP